MKKQLCRKCGETNVERFYKGRYSPCIACTNKIHYKREAEKRKEIEDYKVKAGCVTCGEHHPAVLEFHHRDPNTKKNAISRMVSIYGMERIYEEAKKCDVLCANCHRKSHWLD